MEKCRNCGSPVSVMCQRGTGFCTPTCEEQFDEMEPHIITV